MTLYDLIDRNIYISFFTVIIFLYFAVQTIKFLWNRFLRHLNIRKHGYPPAHCDADGDIIFTPKEVDEYNDFTEQR